MKENDDVIENGNCSLFKTDVLYRRKAIGRRAENKMKIDSSTSLLRLKLPFVIGWITDSGNWDSPVRQPYTSDETIINWSIMASAGESSSILEGDGASGQGLLEPATRQLVPPSVSVRLPIFYFTIIAKNFIVLTPIMPQSSHKRLSSISGLLCLSRSR